MGTETGGVQKAPLVQAQPPCCEITDCKPSIIQPRTFPLYRHHPAQPSDRSQMPHSRGEAYHLPTDTVWEVFSPKRSIFRCEAWLGSLRSVCRDSDVATMLDVPHPQGIFGGVGTPPPLPPTLFLPRSFSWHHLVVIGTEMPPLLLGRGEKAASSSSSCLQPGFTPLACFGTLWDALGCLWDAFGTLWDTLGCLWDAFGMQEA